MHFSLITLAAFVASISASPQAAPSAISTVTTTSSAGPPINTGTGTLGLGAVCNDSSDCANGADCYGVTSFTIKTCGSFQSSCTSDDQCATNTCQNGLCGGFLPSSLYKITSTAASTSTSAATPTTSSSQSTSTGTLGLGAVCNASSDCANGASCYGVTSFTITTCGSFQATCSSDDQCATNTCENGACGGFLASSLYRITSTSSVAGSTSTQSVTASAVTPTSSSLTPSSTLAPFTGGASKEKTGGSVIMAAVVAVWIL